MRLVPIVMGVAAMLSVAVQSSVAQTPSMSFGVTLGGTWSRFTEVDLKAADVLNGQSTMANRTGLQGGAYLTVPLTSHWSVQPEVTYAQNGAILNVAGTSSGSLTFALDYASVTALLRADLGTPGSWHPVLLAGPALAARIKCDGTLKSGSTSLSVACKDLGSNGGTDPFKTSDISGVGGVGLAGSIFGRSLSLQARYTRGFKNVISDPTSSQSPKNSAIAFLLSLGY